MAAKYKSRKELLKKPDEFFTLTGKAIAKARDYQNQIMYALLAIVAIGLIFPDGPRRQADHHALR